MLSWVKQEKKKKTKKKTQFRGLAEMLLMSTTACFCEDNEEKYQYFYVKNLPLVDL